jgi:hypothetical protein
LERRAAIELQVAGAAGAFDVAEARLAVGTGIRAAIAREIAHVDRHVRSSPQSTCDWHVVMTDWQVPIKFPVTHVVHSAFAATTGVAQSVVAHSVSHGPVEPHSQLAVSVTRNAVPAVCAP